MRKLPPPPIPSSLSARLPPRRLACLFLFSLAPVFFFFSCNGNGGGSDSQGELYSTGSHGNNSGNGGNSGNGDGISAWEILNMANGGHTDEIVARLTGGGEEEEESKTFTVSFSAADLQLPAGGWLTLEIEGGDASYKAKAYASADGNVYFTVPILPVGAIITVTLSVYDAEGTPRTSGYKSERVSENGTTNVNVPLINLPPLPVISYGSNGSLNGNSAEKDGVLYTVMEYTGDSLGMTVTNSDPSSTLEVELNGSSCPASGTLPDGFCTITATVTKTPALPSVVSSWNVYVVKKLVKPVITQSGGTENGKSAAKDGKSYTVIEYTGSLPVLTVASSYDGDNAATGSSTLTVADNTPVLTATGSPVSKSFSLSEGYNAIEATLTKEHCITVTEEAYFYVVKALTEPTVTFPNGTKTGTSGSYELWKYSYLAASDYSNLLVTVTNTYTGDNAATGGHSKLTVSGLTGGPYTDNSSVSRKVVPDGDSSITITVSKDYCTDVTVTKYIRASIKPVTVSVGDCALYLHFDDGLAGDTNEIYGTVSLGKNGSFQTLRTFSNANFKQYDWDSFDHNNLEFTLSSKTDYMSYKSEGMYEDDTGDHDDDVSEVNTTVSLSDLASAKRNGWDTKIEVRSSGASEATHRIYLNLSD